MPNSKKGFTLIEIMVAISIVAILATLGLLFFQGAQKTARDARRRSDLDDIKKAMYAYQSANGTFCPASQCPWTATVGDPTWGFGNNANAFDSLKNTLGPLVTGIPSDPFCTPGTTTCTNSWHTYFLYVIDPTHFVIDAQLETPTGNTYQTPYYNYETSQ